MSTITISNLDRLPKISIVTPSFNDDQFLETTIQSVLNQSYPNLEYIVIDGGSTDGSVDIIRKYESRLAYWVSERDTGMYDALQKGFRRSTGEIMGWINSDDMHHPGSLFTLAEVFGENETVNWVQGIPNVVDEKGRVVFVSQGKPVDKFFLYRKKHIQTRHYIQQESTFWRRCLWEKAGGYVSQEYKYAGDFELWIRFFTYDRLFGIPALLGAFRISKREQASIDRYQDYVNETLQALSAHPLEQNELRQLRSLERFEFVQRSVNKIVRWLSGQSGNIPQSAGKFRFDRVTQKFRTDSL